MRASVYARETNLSNKAPVDTACGMITRPDILVLGITASVIGGLFGGILLFVGMTLIMSGQNAGWLLLLATAPVCTAIGWWLARRVARKA